MIRIAVESRRFGNLSLGIHFADLLNFECLQTISLVSHPKFSKNYESNTANTSIVLNANDSSLRGSGEATTKQSKSSESNQNNESMTQKRINTDSLQVSDSQKTQSLPSGLPRLASQVSQ